MASLAFLLFTDPEAAEAQGLFAFLSIGAVALFVFFLPLVTWIDRRHKEREAFYKAETLRRITEASGEGAKAAIEMLQENENVKRLKAREGLKVGGLINIGVGVGLMIFLHALLGGGGGSVNNGGTGSIYLCGLIPGLIGVAMLVYVYLLASPLNGGMKG
ncbi:MAG: hypothetical protein ABR907_01485 [Terracidiphilus sp.]